VGRWALAAMVVAAVLAACGGGSGGDGSAGNGAEASSSGACERGDKKVFDAYVTFLDPRSQPAEVLEVLQFGDRRSVTDYVEQQAFGSQIYSNFAEVFFAGEAADLSPRFRRDEVIYLGHNEAAHVVVTVEQEVLEGRATVQDVGRLVCENARWKMALRDLCVLMGEGRGPECPSDVDSLSIEGFVPALENADLPEVVDPTVPTTVPPPPEPTSPPPPAEPTSPPQPSDGVCPYVGQPCSANVTNDPDCVCTQVGGPGFAQSSEVRSLVRRETVCTRR
jgi:hypothetical protein